MRHYSDSDVQISIPSTELLSESDKTGRTKSLQHRNQQRSGDPSSPPLILKPKTYVLKRI
jgi:hypothetical protein